MTQSPLTWLITASEGESFTQCLTTACRGNDKISALLNVLLYDGALVANRTGLKPKEVEFVRMNLNLDKIVQGLQRLQRSASKQTIIKWREKLEEWGFLKFDGHRQTYDLYFHRIEEAIKQRPPKETTLRGRHATKAKRDSSVESTDSTLDNGDIQSSTIGDSTLEGGDSSVDFGGEIQAWTNKVLKLESQVSNLESEMLKLESLISQERACRAELEAKVETLYNLVNNLTDINLNERKDEPPNDPPPSSHPDDSSFNFSSDLNVNQEGDSDTQPPLQSGAKGYANEPPPIATTTHERQNEQYDTASDGQGYKTGNSSTAETPDSDALNSAQRSVMPDETTQLLSWLSTLEQELAEGKVKRFAVGRIAENPTDMQRLANAVHSRDDTRELYKIVREQQMFSDGRIIWGMNLAQKENIAILQERVSEQAKNERLDREQADEFAQWLMRERGFAWEAVAIDNPYRDPNIWTVCIRYGDEDNAWLRIRNWWHFNHFEDWEQELYALAEAYNDFLSSQQMPVPEPTEQREAIAV